MVTGFSLFRVAECPHQCSEFKVVMAESWWMNLLLLAVVHILTGQAPYTSSFPLSLDPVCIYIYTLYIYILALSCEPLR